MSHPLPFLLVTSMVLLVFTRVADHAPVIPRAVQQHARLGYSVFMVLGGASGLVLPTEYAPAWLCVVLIVVGAMPTRAFIRCLSGRHNEPSDS